MTATDEATSIRLTAGQKTVVAVDLARRHQLTMPVALAYVDTIADQLRILPPAPLMLTDNRCDECGTLCIGHLCPTHRRQEDGPYDDDELEVV